MIDKAPYDIFSCRICIMLGARDMTGKDLADKVHVALSTVSAWCSGVSVPSCRYLPAICEALDCSPCYLLGLSDEVKP